MTLLTQTELTDLEYEEWLERETERRRARHEQDCPCCGRAILTTNEQEED